MIKSTKGTIDVGDPRAWWTEALEKLVATPLVVRPDHVGALATLPPIHKDPFDRMLVAQSIAEGLTLVSADAEISRYSQSGLRLVI
jgi:PIN domain nuclease of toxin-antitoxin system